MNNLSWIFKIKQIIYIKEIKKSTPEKLIFGVVKFISKHLSCDPIFFCFMQEKFCNSYLKEIVQLFVFLCNTNAGTSMIWISFKQLSPCNKTQVLLHINLKLIGKISYLCRISNAKILATLTCICICNCICICICICNYICTCAIYREVVRVHLKSGNSVVNNNFPINQNDSRAFCRHFPLKLNAIVLFQFQICEKPPKFCFTETQVILNTLSSGFENVTAKKGLFWKLQKGGSNTFMIPATLRPYNITWPFDLSHSFC